MGESGERCPDPQPPFYLPASLLHFARRRAQAVDTGGYHWNQHRDAGSGRRAVSLAAEVPLDSLEYLSRRRVRTRGSFEDAVLRAAAVVGGATDLHLSRDHQYADPFRRSKSCRARGDASLSL